MGDWNLLEDGLKSVGMIPRAPNPLVYSMLNSRMVDRIRTAHATPGSTRNPTVKG